MTEKLKIKKKFFNFSHSHENIPVSPAAIMSAAIAIRQYATSKTASAIAWAEFLRLEELYKEACSAGNFPRQMRLLDSQNAVLDDFVKTQSGATTFLCTHPEFLN